MKLFCSRQQSKTPVKVELQSTQINPTKQSKLDSIDDFSIDIDPVKHSIQKTTTTTTTNAKATTSTTVQRSQAKSQQTSSKESRPIVASALQSDQFVKTSTQSSAKPVKLSQLSPVKQAQKQDTVVQHLPHTSAIATSGRTLTAPVLSFINEEQQKKFNAYNLNSQLYTNGVSYAAKSAKSIDKVTTSGPGGHKADHHTAVISNFTSVEEFPPVTVANTPANSTLTSKQAVEQQQQPTLTDKRLIAKPVRVATPVTKVSSATPSPAIRPEDSSDTTRHNAMAVMIPDLHSTDAGCHSTAENTMPNCAIDPLSQQNMETKRRSPWVIQPESVTVLVSPVNENTSAASAADNGDDDHDDASGSHFDEGIQSRQTSMADRQVNDQLNAASVTPPPTEILAGQMSKSVDIGLFGELSLKDNGIDVPIDSRPDRGPISLIGSPKKPVGAERPSSFRPNIPTAIVLPLFNQRASGSSSISPPSAATATQYPNTAISNANLNPIGKPHKVLPTASVEPMQHINHQPSVLYHESAIMDHDPNMMHPKVEMPSNINDLSVHMDNYKTTPLLTTSPTSSSGKQQHNNKPVACTTMPTIVQVSNSQMSQQGNHQPLMSHHLPPTSTNTPYNCNFMRNSFYPTKSLNDLIATKYGQSAPIRTSGSTQPHNNHIGHQQHLQQQQHQAPFNMATMNLLNGIPSTLSSSSMANHMQPQHSHNLKQSNKYNTNAYQKYPNQDPSNNSLFFNDMLQQQQHQQHQQQHTSFNYENGFPVQSFFPCTDYNGPSTTTTNEQKRLFVHK